jgi:hypothetical protein
VSAPVTTPVQSPAIMAALSVIGTAWLAVLSDASAAMSAIDQSLVLDGAVWRPWDVAGRGAFPNGLNLAEALGATYVMRWARDGVADMPRFAATLPVARALLALRREAFPSAPWRPRDPVAEDLQRRIRVMEVAEAPRKPVVVLKPYTAPSDIGREWKGRRAYV